MFKHKVSICMPTYNQPDYLRFVLDTIVMQDFKDYELIISDDSTNNESEEIVKEYRNKINNLTYTKNNPRKGSPVSWNFAISQAKGEYIKVLHNDDWFPDSTSLSKFVKMLDDNPKCDFAFSATYVCDPNKKIKHISRSPKEAIAKLKNTPIYLFGNNIIGAPSATIYRSTIQNKYYDEKLKWVVDVEQYIRIIKENNKFQYFDEPLICTTDGAAHQSIHSSVGIKKVELFEWIYLYSKFSEKDKQTFYIFYIWIYILFILYRCNISSLKDIEDIDINKKELRLLNNLLKFKFIFMIFKVRKFLKKG